MKERIPDARQDYHKVLHVFNIKYITTYRLILQNITKNIDNFRLSFQVSMLCHIPPHIPDKLNYSSLNVK